MTDYAIAASRGGSGRIARKALDFAAKFWFLVMAAGQWIFISYVISFYGGSALDGNLAAWNQVMPHGFVSGDAVGNGAAVAHIMLAVIIMIGGPLQLVPAIRNRFPAFHRWTGRSYMLACVTTSLAGLYMIWTRGTVGDMSMHLGLTFDGLLIIAFATLSLKEAMARNIPAHRRWALRMFMVASAVWFFRIGFMGWLAANGGPVGIDTKTFTGPFLTFWAFGQYLLPLAVLELYLFAKDRAGALGKGAMAAGLFILTLVMAFGTFAATMGMWLPRIT